MSEVVLGIDADTRRVAWAWCYSDGEMSPARTIMRSNSRGAMTADYDQKLNDSFEILWRAGGCIYLEGIYLPAPDGPRAERRNVRAFAALAEVHGEIKWVARGFGLRVEVVTPNKWHSAILGFTTGRAELKAAAMEKARDLTGLDDLTEHEADAVCIALYGWRRENEEGE